MADLPKAFSLFRTFVHLERDGSATPMRVGGAFWVRLRQQTLDGRLAGAFRMTRNTASFGSHPCAWRGIGRGSRSR
jgi:hypothetical protein